MFIYFWLIDYELVQPDFCPIYIAKIPKDYYSC